MKPVRWKRIEPTYLACIQPCGWCPPRESNPLLVGSWVLVCGRRCICKWSALRCVLQRSEAALEDSSSEEKPGDVEDCLRRIHQGRDGFSIRRP